MGSAVHIIPSQQLDKAAWDNCVKASHNGLIYATSAYLDAMATQWDAMVLNDYEYVMPLPWRKKYSTYYVYPPAFIQQLGIFSPHEITQPIINLFINAIPAKYKYSEMHFNYANEVHGDKIPTHKNYLLNLQPGYDALRNDYSRSAVRNITKATDAGITVQENVDAAAIIQMHRKRFADKIGATASDYDHFLALCNLLLQNGQCITVGAYTHGHTLIAGSIYFLYKNRLTFILSGNTPESLTCGATHLLKDYIIRKFAGQDLLLDFEGSDFENFARFYQQFGAKETEHYCTMVINRLPFFMRLLKR